MKDFLKALPHNNLTRVILLVILAASVVAPFHWAGAMALPIAWILVISALTLAVRKVLFTYVDLKKYAARSFETPMSAAIVFLSVVLLMGVIALCGTVVMVAPYLMQQDNTAAVAQAVYEATRAGSDSTLLVRDSVSNLDSLYIIDTLKAK